MKITRFFLSTVLFVALAACQTPYGRNGLMGGYTDEQVSERVWNITAEGNGFATMERTYNIALVRAAELVLENGGTHFVVLDRGESILNRPIYGQYGQIGTARLETVTLQIEMLEDDFEKGLDAIEVVTILGSEIGYNGPTAPAVSDTE